MRNGMVFRVDVEQGKAGLFYATSPDLRGLLVGRANMDELRDEVPRAIADLLRASDHYIADFGIDWRA